MTSQVVEPEVKVRSEYISEMKMSNLVETAVRNQDPANRNQAESGLPFLKKMPAPHLQEGLWGVGYHTPEDPFKRLDKPTFEQ